MTMTPSSLMRWSRRDSSRSFSSSGSDDAAYVEAQVDRVGDLVDVLPAGALRAYGLQLDFLFGEDVGDQRHGGCQVIRLRGSC